MPHVNAQGKIAHGTGNAGAYLDNVKFSDGDQAYWFNETTIVFNRDGGGGAANYVAYYDITTEVITQAADWEPKVVLYGSGSGVWAAENDDEEDDERIVGLFSSTSFQNDDAHLMGVGPAGSIAFIPNHDNDSPCQVRELNGTEYLLTAGNAEDVCLIEKGQAVWCEGGVLKSKGMPAIQVLTGPVANPKMVAAGGKWWIAYHSTVGTVLHPIDSVEGYKPVTGTPNFDMGVLSGQPNVIRFAWATASNDTAVDHVDIDVITTPTEVLGTPGTEVPGGPEVAPTAGPGTIILTSSGSFGVAAAAEELVTIPIIIFPAYPVASGHGRIVHPILGPFDYEVKPDEWMNIDADAIIPPIWSSSRTLTSAANVLWEGNLRDVVVEERWKALGGLAMPATQLRMLLAIWTNPVDPDVGYVHWYPNYITQMGFKVLPVGLSAGGQGITFDDVVNYLDDDGNPIGWMTAPVTFTLKMVERLVEAAPVGRRQRQGGRFVGARR